MARVNRKMKVSSSSRKQEAKDDMCLGCLKTHLVSSWSLVLLGVLLHFLCKCFPLHALHRFLGKFGRAGEGVGEGRG